ncbi:hypothetical protein [Devosia sp.]|uniref:hypothetical protein n=1 Tax=Devosia sp. TaxID=1871048 RepID=UPI0037BE57E5
MIRALAALTVLVPGLALAAGDDILSGLADVLAAEDFCKLTYDQPAIEAFIQAHVAPDDLDFTSNLTAFIYVAGEHQLEMTTSAATAHCTQIRRLAKTYGFTKP